MSRRSLAWSLIVLAVIACLAAFVWFAVPFLSSKKSSTQPSPLPKTGQPTTGRPSNGIGTASSSRAGTELSANKRQAQDRLKQQAADFTSRIGSYSSVNGFDALREASLSTNADVRAVLMKQRSDLTLTHPTFGPSWGQTTRAIAVRIVNGFTVLNATNAEVVVQSQHSIESADGFAKPTYDELHITFAKDHGIWTVTHLETTPFVP